MTVCERKPRSSHISVDGREQGRHREVPEKVSVFVVVTLGQSYHQFSSDNFLALLLFCFSTCRWDCKRILGLWSHFGPGFPAAIHPLLYRGDRRSFGWAAAPELQTVSTCPGTLGLLTMCPSPELCLRRCGHGHLLHPPGPKGLQLVLEWETVMKTLCLIISSFKYYCLTAGLCFWN